MAILPKMVSPMTSLLNSMMYGLFLNILNGEKLPNVKISPLTLEPDKEALETILFIGFLFWGGVNMKLLI